MSKDEIYIDDLIKVKQELKEKDDLLEEAVFLIGALIGLMPKMSKSFEKKLKLKLKLKEVLFVNSMKFLTKNCFKKAITSQEIEGSDEKMIEFSDFIKDNNEAFIEKSIKEKFEECHD